ncbi:hypothetical protein [Alkalihalobacterium chitinilyticum]|uniref:DUF1294 domain-containing protein n=1 Tax=Alkalihalobacterium chitinilyticum TaxID=2980103 RepID=A0ABT5VG78_9BACI|nr:hypothetical protein [Alkalihalobacterium chitinilyticum]MDE5414332.1 hypothetical protein [Alkalihalobacterium chitinilyticum]
MQITFISSKKAKKIVNGYLIFLIASLFVISYLGGDHDYISVKAGLISANILFAVGMIIGYIYLFTYPKKERKEYWFVHSITVAFYVLLNIYLIFLR